ncbi:MAG: hypothetical protein M1434_07740 [Chloroflexi bacterium]|nr:hypothetical protein [Chloroflexota bacterium]MCL5274622.1 hypothetical protein [Chloroflexota bacterium]
MLQTIVGLICAMLLLVNGFAALRRPLNALVERDPIGKRLLARRGEVVTLRVYRIYGAAMVVLGMVVAYLVLTLSSRG